MRLLHHLINEALDKFKYHLALFTNNHFQKHIMTDLWYLQTTTELNEDALKCAQARQQQLTKPAGSLGELENIALQFAAWQGKEIPSITGVLIRVFAGDHGVCGPRFAEDGSAIGSVSAFPQSVTSQMVHNFLAGGAAISVLSKQLGADFAVVNMGTVEPLDITHPQLITHQLMNGTNDFTEHAAMSEQTLHKALQAGRNEVLAQRTTLFIAGEMGIGNTTSASAIVSLLLKTGPEATVGSGTGVDKDGIAVKRRVIYQAFNKHSGALETPLSILQHVGGLEIAALVGAYITAAQQGIPILVDGFITTAAALLAVDINPSVRKWMMFSHQSAEKGHELALKKLDAKPLLNLGLRLGEASGAAVAVPLIQSALALHAQMATFAEASVSNLDHQ